MLSVGKKFEKNEVIFENCPNDVEETDIKIVLKKNFGINAEDKKEVVYIRVYPVRRSKSGKLNSTQVRIKFSENSYDVIRNSNVRRIVMYWGVCENPFFFSFQNRTNYQKYPTYIKNGNQIGAEKTRQWFNTVLGISPISVIRFKSNLIVHFATLSDIKTALKKKYVSVGGNEKSIQRVNMKLRECEVLVCLDNELQRNRNSKSLLMKNLKSTLSLSHQQVIKERPTKSHLSLNEDIFEPSKSRKFIQKKKVNRKEFILTIVMSNELLQQFLDNKKNVMINFKCELFRNFEIKSQGSLTFQKRKKSESSYEIVAVTNDEKIVKKLTSREFIFGKDYIVFCPKEELFKGVVYTNKSSGSHELNEKEMELLSNIDVSQQKKIFEQIQKNKYMLRQRSPIIGEEDVFGKRPEKSFEEFFTSKNDMNKYFGEESGETLLPRKKKLAPSRNNTPTLKKQNYGNHDDQHRNNNEKKARLSGLQFEKGERERLRRSMDRSNDDNEGGMERETMIFQSGDINGRSDRFKIEKSLQLERDNDHDTQYPNERIPFNQERSPRGSGSGTKRSRIGSPKISKYINYVEKSESSPGIDTIIRDEDPIEVQEQKKLIREQRQIEIEIREKMERKRMVFEFDKESSVKKQIKSFLETIDFQCVDVKQFKRKLKQNVNVSSLEFNVLGILSFALNKYEEFNEYYVKHLRYVLMIFSIIHVQNKSLSNKAKFIHPKKATRFLRGLLTFAQVITNEICDVKSYQVGGKVVRFPKCSYYTKMYEDKFIFFKKEKEEFVSKAKVETFSPKMRHEKMIVFATHKDRVEICGEYCRKYKTAIFNEAYPFKPGGDYEMGGTRMEEDLFRRSNLHHFLVHPPTGFTWEEKWDYPISKFGGLISKGVIFFRGQRKNGYPFLNEPIQCDVISVGKSKIKCVSNNKVNNNKYRLQFIELNKVSDKFEVILKIAIENNIECLILNDFYCHESSPKQIVKMMNKVLNEYRRLFKVVIFAVDGSFTSMSNLVYFEDVFGIENDPKVFQKKKE